MKILITIENGICQSVCANGDVEVVVIDYDNNGDEPVIVSEILAPDVIIGKKEMFHEQLFKKNSKDEDENFTRKALKKLKF